MQPSPFPAARALSEVLVGHEVAVSLDLSNYELLWPATLFAAEGERILPVRGRAWEEPARKGIWLRPGILLGALTPAADGLGNRGAVG